MLDIVFVVLNYNVVEITIDCIKSIEKNIDTSNYRIILVDNASSNQSGEKLQQFFLRDNHVVFLKNNKNVGFARGNNLGIDLARKKYPAKFICCINNDTLLRQENFFEILNHKYEATRPAIIGPRIQLADGKYEPIMDPLRSLDEYKRTRDKLLHESLYWTVIRESLLKLPFFKILNDWRHKLSGDTASDYKELKNAVNKENMDVILHGCCLIFTPKFFLYFDGFHPGTFMYGEEDIIFFLVRSKRMHTLYTPELNIVHLEKKSTSAINKRAIDRTRFVKENQIKSLQVIIDVMSEHLSNGEHK
jgi:GT2 family glycosyltransferase